MKLLSRLAPLCALAAAMSLFGQGLTGNLSGTVTDQSGSAVPGAEITLTNVATNQVRKSQSEPNGGFTFTQLLPSTYKLQVTSKGFKRYEQTDIVLTANPSREDLQDLAKEG
jgi:hypothetical protein